MLDAGHLDVDGGGVTRCDLEALYTDMQLIHRGRCVGFVSPWQFARHDTAQHCAAAAGGV
jgi:hypothetical protein